MRPQVLAPPAAAGALCLAFTCAGAEAARAQTTTATPAPTPEPTAQAAQKAHIAIRQRKLNVRAGDRTTVSGRIAPGLAGLVVALQVERGQRWRALDRDRTDRAGRYELRQRLRHTLSRRARVRVHGAPGVLAGARLLGRLNVFRYAHASWYGPGLYGNRTGCGGTLGAGELGVAHKSLPCGTLVTLQHGRRRVRVPVIDRGPYVGGREYDLTEATAQRLGFRGHGAILVTR